MGVAKSDTAKDADYLAGKLVRMRIFAGHEGDCRKGRRPDFDRAAPPELARSLYEHFVNSVESILGRVQTGVFQTRMEVRLVNDGPVTLICDS